MAKGNIGNLLQHFVALHVAENLVAGWGQPLEAIEYIDCFSMAPWEAIKGNQSQGFVERVKTFEEKSTQGDFVADIFLKAWNTRYASDAIPKHPRSRDYPNTAVLLTTAFPEQHWNMRLHEDDSSAAGKNALLTSWAAERTNGTYTVSGKWAQSEQIFNAPLPIDRPVMVMLDPTQIVKDDSTKADNAAYLSAQRIRYLFGEHALRVSRRARQANLKPLVIMAFSFAETYPEYSNKIMHDQFKPADGWQIERVTLEHRLARGTDSVHQGWIISSGLEKPIFENSLQSAWDHWNELAPATVA